MINSINLQKVRQLCDRAGYKSEICKDFVSMIFTDKEFGNNIVIYIYVTDNHWIKILGLGGIDVDKSDLAEALKRVNDYNANHKIMKAFIASDGCVGLHRQELIDEYVSEEFIYENFLRMGISCILDFYREYFADFV